MPQLSEITAVLDANVLYPAPIRDYLLYLAKFKFFKPKWTEEIHAEWMNKLLENRPDITRQSLESAQDAMNAAFPDALVAGYEKITKSLSLPDQNDRHVLAAAIKTKANVIVTFNTRVLPKTMFFW